MEAAPPSYEYATLSDHLDLVAGALPSADLCSAALVCSRWHLATVRHLWGNPASHFGIENDRVYVALTRFKRTLRIARLLVRSLTHTLHLPPAHAELYEGPHADWLRDILDRLPNLQSLIVRGLPFFDHGALSALKHVPPKARPSSPRANAIELPASSGYSFEGVLMTSVSFTLRLLDASRCPNVTAGALATALRRFENLLYLDLSFTAPARSPDVLSTIHCLSGLQVLKLRSIGLSDDGLRVLVSSIGRGVRSLDVRNNRITDRGIRLLLDNCFAVSSSQPHGTRSPALLPYLGQEMLDIYQGEEFEGYLRDTFTRNFMGRLAIEDVPRSGITHLYIANNPVTAEGASGLVRSERLHVLDLASGLSELSHLSSSTSVPTDSPIDIPGVEKLTPVLAQHGAETLTFARIGHAVVTKDAQPGRFNPSLSQNRAELADTALPPLPAHSAELDGTIVEPEIYEMPAVTTPTAELPGDPIHVIVSPAVSRPFGQGADDVEEAVRRGSAFAPEVRTEKSSLSEARPNGSPGVLEGSLAPEIVQDQEITRPGRARSPSNFSQDRKARVNAHALIKHFLHPAMLPHLTSLVLTDVPPFSSDRAVAERLIEFIELCAEEASLAKKQALVDYSAPPGRKGHVSALKTSASKAFALRRLVLEIAPEQSLEARPASSGWKHSSTKSMTEDRDSESLWSAAETDFSFFGDGEECGLPSLEPQITGSAFTSAEKEVVVPVQPQHNVKQPGPQYDTVALIGAFRRERRQAHQQRLSASGGLDVDTKGYWDGLVQVIRPVVGLREDEERDYYGNVFTGGYLYR